MLREYPFEKAAQLLKAAAHPVRLNILCILKEGPRNVREIQELTMCKQSITSQHLRGLTERELLERRRKGNEVFYSIKNEAVFDLLCCIKKCCKPKDSTGRK